MNSHYHHTSKEDLIKEFNLNYKNYLESLIIFQIINEIVNEKKSKKTNLSEEKLLNRFWKSYLLTNINLDDYLARNENDLSSSLSSSILLSSSFTAAASQKLSNQSEYMINQFKIDDFNEELKTELINEIERYYEGYLCKIENIMKNDLELSDEDRCLVLSNKLKDVAYTTKLNSKQIQKLNDDINVKIKNYLNLTHEILNLLIKLMNEFKLGFYLRKDLISLESLLFKCDMFLTKIETILGECLMDTYTSDKLKCLNIIKENIQINSMKYKEKYESMKNALKLYKSLGGEFESIHKSYVELKNKLDNRKWTLNKLKNEIFY